MYTGKLDLTGQSSENILELLIASDELLLKELFKHIQDYLIQERINWTKQNFVQVFHTVSKLFKCKKL